MMIYLSLSLSLLEAQRDQFFLYMAVRLFWGAFPAEHSRLTLLSTLSIGCGTYPCARFLWPGQNIIIRRWLHQGVQSVMVDQHVLGDHITVWRIIDWGLWCTLDHLRTAWTFAVVCIEDALLEDERASEGCSVGWLNDMVLLCILCEDSRCFVKVGFVSDVFAKEFIFKISIANSSGRFKISFHTSWIVCRAHLIVKYVRSSMASLEHILALSHWKYLLVQVVRAPHIRCLVSLAHVEKGRLLHARTTVIIGRGPLLMTHSHQIVLVEVCCLLGVSIAGTSWCTDFNCSQTLSIKHIWLLSLLDLVQHVSMDKIALV